MMREAFLTAAENDPESMKMVKQAIDTADEAKLSGFAKMVADRIAEEEQKRIETIRANMKKTVWIYTVVFDRFSFIKGYLFADTYQEAADKVRKQYKKFSMKPVSTKIEELDYANNLVELHVQM